MPNTTVDLSPLDPANPGDPGHIEDHNLLRLAAVELQTVANLKLEKSNVVAGSNVTVTPAGSGNNVTIAVPTAPSHTHSEYALESSPDTLQDQIDALVAQQAGPISISNLPAGSIIVVDKAKAEAGHAAGAWPTTRPTSRTDMTVMWKGNSDPALTDPNPVLPQDIWFNTA